MKAQKSLSSISASRDLWIAQYRRELAERDHFSGLEAARRKGLDEGRKEGHRKRLVDGVRMTARNLLALDMNTETSVKATGLSEDEIRKLRENSSNT